MAVGILPIERTFMFVSRCIFGIVKPDPSCSGFWLSCSCAVAEIGPNTGQNSIRLSLQT